MMNTRPILQLLSAMALASGCSLFASGTEREPATNAAEIAGAPTAGPEKKGALVKGMAAGEVVKLIGKPGRVAKLTMPEGNAEKWTYRRLVNETTTQEATTVADEPAFVGVGAGTGTDMMGTRPVLKYSTKHVSTYQVTALLMVNDRLVVAKQWNEQEVRYDN